MAVRWGTTSPPTLEAYGLAFGAALLVALAITAVARRSGGLDTSGAIAAALAGTAAILAGRAWGGFLIVWFVVASASSRPGRVRKEARTAGVVEKGAQRDAGQVVANGGVYTLAAVASMLGGDPAADAALWGAAALTAAGADTLATEIGTWIGGPPRSIRTWQRMPTGSSGAISGAGTAAMIGTAALLAALAVAFGLVPTRHWWIVAVAGVFGAVVDTLAGALVQQRRWCATCACFTEQRRHRCGTDTRHWGGWRWLGNDEVNLLCTASAGTLAWLLGRLAT